MSPAAFRLAANRAPKVGMGDEFNMADSLHFVALARQQSVEHRSSDDLRWGMPLEKHHEPVNEFAEIGARVTTARRQAGFSLKSAADALQARGHQISDKALGHWETGTRQLDAVWMRRLANLYGVSVEAFYMDTAITAEEVKLAAQFRSLVLKQAASSMELSHDEKTLQRRKFGDQSSKLTEKPQRADKDTG